MRIVGKTAILLLVIALFNNCSSGGSGEEILFVSFKDPGNTGFHYAISKDGLSFTGLNEGLPAIPMSVKSPVMRDPSIARDPEKGFHVVWTSGKQRIGYAFSEDLVSWTVPKIIPVDVDNDSIIKTLSPELFYDDMKQEWLILYTSSIKGAFPSTEDMAREGMNSRIYVVRTKDFESFSDSELFLDPGYPVSQAFILKDAENYKLAYTDERDNPEGKVLHIAESNSLDGPWKNVNEITDIKGVEGPSMMKRGSSYHLYYDHYKFPFHMGVIATDDFKTWEEVQESFYFPFGYKQGSFIVITKEEAERIYSTYPLGEEKPKPSEMEPYEELFNKSKKG